MSRMMIGLGAMAIAVAGGGCFATWGAVQASGNPRILDESTREVAVPLPGVEELLAVRMPLAVQRTNQAQPVQPGVQAPPSERLPLELGCFTSQRGRETVYRSGFRYGTKWKYAAVTMFVLEAATAAAVFYSDRENPQNQLAAGLIALDAIGTGALIFAPRKEVFHSEVRGTSNRVRGDCPDGLALDIAGEVFPIDAAGRIGDLGEAALDAWMQAPAGPGAQVRVTYQGRGVDVRLGELEQCAWNRSHHPDQPSRCPMYGPIPPTEVAAVIDVPLGTLSRAE